MKRNVILLFVLVGACTFDRLDQEPDAPVDAAVADSAAPDAITAMEALDRWRACMTYEDWVAAGMNAFINWSSNQGTCESCHSSGAYGYMNNDDPLAMFMWSRQYPSAIVYIHSQEVDGQELFLEYQPSSWLANVGVTHMYTLGAERTAALRRCFDLTLAALMAGTCDQPRAVPNWAARTWKISPSLLGISPEAPF